MTRYIIVDRTSADHDGVASPLLLLSMNTDEDDAVSAWRERVDDVSDQPNVSRRRIVLFRRVEVCRWVVIREFDSQSADDQRSRAGR